MFVLLFENDDLNNPKRLQLTTDYFSDWSPEVGDWLNWHQYQRHDGSCKTVIKEWVESSDVREYSFSELSKLSI